MRYIITINCGNCGKHRMMAKIKKIIKILTQKIVLIISVDLFNASEQAYCS